MIPGIPFSRSSRSCQRISSGSSSPLRNQNGRVPYSRRVARTSRGAASSLVHGCTTAFTNPSGLSIARLERHRRSRSSWNRWVTSGSIAIPARRSAGGTAHPVHDHRDVAEMGVRRYGTPSSSSARGPSAVARPGGSPRSPRPAHPRQVPKHENGPAPGGLDRDVGAPSVGQSPPRRRRGTRRVTFTVRAAPEPELARSASPRASATITVAGPCWSSRADAGGAPCSRRRSPRRRRPAEGRRARSTFTAQASGSRADLDRACRRRPHAVFARTATRSANPRSVTQTATRSPPRGGDLAPTASTCRRPRGPDTRATSRARRAREHVELGGADAAHAPRGAAPRRARLGRGLVGQLRTGRAPEDGDPHAPARRRGRSRGRRLVGVRLSGFA